jgi:hypothetical protein
MINWFIVGVNIPSYSENEFYDYIKKYNIHALTFLNKWGETWCYSLTKAFHSGLPIIYNNFGVFKERIPENTKHYFKVYDNENDTDIGKLYSTFEKMISYIIKYQIDKESINYNEYYDNLFKPK